MSAYSAQILWGRFGVGASNRIGSRASSLSIDMFDQPTSPALLGAANHTNSDRRVKMLSKPELHREIGKERTAIYWC